MNCPVCNQTAYALSPEQITFLKSVSRFYLEYILEDHKQFEQSG